MKSADISTAAVEEALSAWRYARPGSPALLELAALQNPVNHVGQKEPLTLRDFINTLVESQLQQQRLLAGITPEPPLLSKEAVRAAVKADFQANQKALAAWSALFFRYLAPVALSVTELAAAIPLSPHHFRYSLRDVGFVHVLPLSELSLAASKALIESELERHGRATTLSQSAAAAIYQTVGGLPLALML